MFEYKYYYKLAQFVYFWWCLLHLPLPSFFSLSSFILTFAPYPRAFKAKIISVTAVGLEYDWGVLFLTISSLISANCCSIVSVDGMTVLLNPELWITFEDRRKRRRKIRTVIVRSTRKKIEKKGRRRKWRRRKKNKNDIQKS